MVGEERALDEGLLLADVVRWWPYLELEKGAG